MADLIAHSPIDHGFGWLKQWREQSHQYAYDKASQIVRWLNFPLDGVENFDPTANSVLEWF
jgi:hypothetical protein